MADKFNIYDDKGKKLADAQPSPVKVSGLKPNTTYSGWVAKREDDTGDQEISSFKTKDVKPVAPTVQATPDDGKISVKIVAGNDEGSAGTTGTIYYTDGTTPKTKTLKPGYAGVISSLTNGTEYSLQATVTNGVGESPKSATVKATPVAPAPVLMKSFSLNKNEITGKVGDVVKVDVYDVAPENATEKGINVSSSDKTIATAVDNFDGSYSVTLVKEGTTTVHWVAVDEGGAKKDLTVTVSADTPETTPPAE